MKLAIQRHLGGEAGGADDADDLVRATRNRVAKEIERVIIHTSSDDRDRPRLDWRRVLREAFPERRVVQPNYLRPNRRFPARIGEIPGRSRRPPKPELLVGIDTSASMTVDVLADIAREVHELGRHAQLTIIECDAAVHRVYPLVGELGPFVGGGDTDFTPVFESPEIGTRAHFQGVVMFTDGRGEMPSASKLPSLWVITHADPFLPPFGRVVRLPVSG